MAYQEGVCAAFVFQPENVGTSSDPENPCLRASVITSFPEQAHKEKSTTPLAVLNMTKLSVISVTGREHPTSCPSCEDITCRNILMNGSLWLSGVFICTYMHICIWIFLFFQKRSGGFLRRPSIKTFL